MTNKNIDWIEDTNLNIKAHLEPDNKTFHFIIKSDKLRGFEVLFDINQVKLFNNFLNKILNEKDTIIIIPKEKGETTTNLSGNIKINNIKIKEVYQ